MPGNLMSYIENPDITQALVNAGIGFLYGPLINKLEWLSSSNLIRTASIGVSSLLASTIVTDKKNLDMFILEPAATGILNGLGYALVPHGSSFKKGLSDGFIIGVIGGVGRYGYDIYYSDNSNGSNGSSSVKPSATPTVSTTS